jgi:acyl-ACP thioesterase
MDAELGIWRERLQIHSYDVDFHKRATVEAISRTFLEAAWNHAEQLGFGYARLATQNQLWVLARLAIQVDLYPQWGQTIEVITWPRGTSSVPSSNEFPS